MKGFFITGTDTDAGKTVASAAIVSLLKDKGVNVVPVKPAQTGCTSINGKLNAPDLDFTLKITDLKLEHEIKDLLSPYKFEPACSPHLAANLANCKITVKKIVESIKQISDKSDTMVIEGAGGIMVPLNDSEMMIDLMSMLSLPVILTARPGLGTINHTLLSIKALRDRGLEVAGVIFCATEPLKGDYIEMDNVKSIEKFGNIKVLGTIPFIDNIEKISSESFLKIIKKNISLPN